MSRNFEELEVWRKGCNLSVRVYQVMSLCKDFGLKDQITRSAISIPSNIAEGAERSTQKEYLRFLDIAKGSAGELRTQLYILLALKIIEKKIVADLIREAKEISRMLQALQNALTRSPKPDA